MEQIYRDLNRHKLTPNQAYTLWAIREKETTPFVTPEHEYKVLKQNGWLTPMLAITKKADRVLKELDSYFKKKKKDSNAALMGEEFEANMIKYNSFYPKKKLNTGKYARSSIKNLEPVFRWFFKNHDFTWEQIFKAVANYCDDREAVNWDYCINSAFFVRKGLNDKSFKSDLADWCQAVVDGADEPEKEHFQDNVY